LDVNGILGIEIRGNPKPLVIDRLKAKPVTGIIHEDTDELWGNKVSNPID
jgi:hypothetical protein